MEKQSDGRKHLSKTPYKGYRLPGTLEEEENRLAEEVDPNLRPEDHGMVLRYLHYADTLLNSPEKEESSPPLLLRPEQKSVKESPETRKSADEQADEQEDRGNGQAA
jgi:hypothetical protein